MFRSLALAVSLVAALSAGCSSHDATGTPPAAAKPVAATPAAAARPAAAAPASSPALASCTQVMTRARSCTDVFLPALVDARAQADVPAGIAAQVKADRDAVIAQARTEWARDSSDAGIARTCAQLAAHADAADQQEAQSCLSRSDCTAFTACVVPVMAKHFKK